MPSSAHSDVPRAARKNAENTRETVFMDDSVGLQFPTPLCGLWFVASGFSILGPRPLAVFRRRFAAEMSSCHSRCDTTHRAVTFSLVAWRGPEPPAFS